ncbi:MAG TPA: hypothetical protein PLK80_00225 [bacterium]|nr:hypothetical protein [bacterium]HPN94285.1 hypothetical protein [bacterium]
MKRAVGAVAAFARGAGGLLWNLVRTVFSARNISVASKLIIAAAIVAQLAPGVFNFGEEHAAPALFILIYTLSALSLLALLWAGIPAAAVTAIIAAVSGLAGKILKRKPGVPLSAVGRAAVAIARFYAWLLILGAVFTGFLIESEKTRLGALSFLAAHLAVGAFAAAVGGVSRRAQILKAAGTVAVGAGLYAALSRFDAVLSSGALFAGCAGFIAWRAARRRDSRKIGATSIFKTLAACSFPVCALICAAFALEIVNAGDAAGGGLRKISDAGRVYDVKYDSELSRLYVTSRDKPNARYINAATGAEIVSPHDIPEPRRIAVFPEHDRVLIGSVYGLKSLSLDLAGMFDEKIFESHTVDVEKTGSDTAAIAQEIINNIIVYDLKSGKRRHVTLPNGTGWIYAIERSERPGAFYASNWFFSPFVHRVEGKNYGDIKTAFNGFMNVGICAMPDRGLLLVARPLHRRVDALDALTLERKGWIPTGFGVREIECDRKSGLLFTLAHYQGDLSVYDVDAKKELAKLKVGAGARAVSYDEAGKILYVGTTTGVYAADLKEILARNGVE